jgi:hypothetical protein
MLSFGAVVLALTLGQHASPPRQDLDHNVDIKATNWGANAWVTRRGPVACADDIGHG